MKTVENELNQLNPRILNVTVGIRNPRKIKMYPLSLKDETDLLDLIKEGMEGLAKLGEAETDTLEVVDFVSFLIQYIVTNIGTVLTKVIDEYSDDLLSEIDNEQAMDIATQFLTQNFGGIAKKAQSFLGLEGEGLSLLWKQFAQSSPDIPNSVSNIFSDIVSKKEDLQEAS